MSASKSCPACLKQWAGTFKFCPEDGALLVALNTAETVLQTEALSAEVAAAHATQSAKAKLFNASDTVVVPAVVPYQTDASLPAVRAAAANDTVVVAAVKSADTDEYASVAPQKDESWRSPLAAPPVERSPTSPKARKGAPRLLNLEPIEPSAAATSTDLPVVQAAGNGSGLAIEVQDPSLRRELGLRVAPTVMTPSAVELIASESRALAAQPFERHDTEPSAIAVAAVSGDASAGSGRERGLKRVDVSTEPGRPEAKREQGKGNGASALVAQVSGRAPAEARGRNEPPPKKGQGQDTKSTRASEAPKGRTPAQTAPHGKGAAKHAAQAAAPTQKAQAQEPAKPSAAEAGKSGKAPQGVPTTQQPIARTSLPGKAQPDIVSLSKGPTTSGGLRKRSAFSDTDWFMRPDLPVDTETGRVQVDPQAYVRDESIPEEQRRRFSLRRKDEE